VGDPAGKEKQGRRCREVGGIVAGVAEEVAGVVEGHQDHDEAAGYIDGFETDALGGCYCGFHGCDCVSRRSLADAS
jgi:sugar lactone lactonase YvrE